MKIILGGRQQGKTMKLIKLSASSMNYIVCRSLEESNRIQQIARREGLKIPLPITYSEFKDGCHGNQISGFLIDDVEDLLRFLSQRVPVNAFSVTIEHGGKT